MVVHIADFERGLLDADLPRVHAHALIASRDLHCIDDLCLKDDGTDESGWDQNAIEATLLPLWRSVACQNATCSTDAQVVVAPSLLAHCVYHKQFNDALRTRYHSGRNTPLLLVHHSMAWESSFSVRWLQSLSAQPRSFASRVVLAHWDGRLLDEQPFVKLAMGGKRNETRLLAVPYTLPLVRRTIANATSPRPLLVSYEGRIMSQECAAAPAGIASARALVPPPRQGSQLLVPSCRQRAHAHAHRPAERHLMFWCCDVCLGSMQATPIRVFLREHMLEHGAECRPHQGVEPTEKDGIATPRSEVCALCAAQSAPHHRNGSAHAGRECTHWLERLLGRTSDGLSVLDLAWHSTFCMEPAGDTLCPSACTGTQLQP